MTLSDFVEIYIHTESGSTNELLGWYAQLPSLENTVKKAAHALTKCEKRHSHQYRIRKEAIIQAEEILLGLLPDIQQRSNFDDLITLIEASLLEVKWLGELYCYDTTQRIGAYLGIYPEYVYLHAGTRIGAKNLGLPYKVRYLKVDELPKQLQKLKPHEIEDLLCLRKDDFMNSEADGSVRSCSARQPAKKNKNRC